MMNVVRTRLLVIGIVVLFGLGCDQSVDSKRDKAVAPEVSVQKPLEKPEPSAASDSKAEQVSVAKPFVEDESTLPPGADWPIFLGLKGTGVSDETDLLDEWPEDGPPVVWQKPVGKGYSSPSIRGNRLVVHHRKRAVDVIECVRADDGSPVWTYEYETDFSDPYGYNNGPRCSPLLTEDRCYTFGAQGRLVCLELSTGKLIWERETAKDWNVPQHFFGAGCSPILESGSLIVLVGGQPDSGVVAFDPATGKTKWESVGKSTWDGAIIDGPGKSAYSWTGDEMLVSYSSPFAATIHGNRHLLCLVRQGLVSLDPVDGRVRFKYWFRSRTHESVNAARPVVVDDLVFLSAAYETGAALLKVGADGNSFEEVWRNKRGMSTHWSTPVHDAGYIYGFSGRHENEAMLQCVDLKTGELQWETNGFEGKLDDLEQDPASGQIKNAKSGKIVPWPFYGRGSKTRADGKYIVLGERGTLALTTLSREGWKEISRTSYKNLKAPMWASPVLSRGRLYLRSEDWLVCLQVAKSK